MKVKVCGMRVPANIEAILQLPVDFLGFIFYRKSPRYAGNGKLDQWIEANAERFGEVKRVGVFVNAEIDEVLNRVHDYRLDYVQLHGEESPEYCRELLSFWEVSTLRRARLIKVFSVDEAFDFYRTNAYTGLCALFLFDTKTPDYGGSGRAFDWSKLDQYLGTTPFLLAGGIGPDSSETIRGLTHPQLYGVDINSLFEESPGVKSVEQVRHFIEAVKSAS